MDREDAVVAGLHRRPVLADPLAAVAAHTAEIDRARASIRRDVTRRLDVEAARIEHLAARLATLGPAATLADGYAVVTAGDRVLRSTVGAPPGTALRIRLADGSVAAHSDGPDRSTGEIDE